MPPIPGLVDPGLLAVYLAFWVGMSLLWTPFLAARSVRGLLATWPTSRIPANYALAMGAVTLVHAVGLLAGLLGFTAGGANLLAVFRYTLVFSAAFVVLVWAVASLGLPRVGRWDPTGEGYDGRVVLAGGAVWYLCCTAILAGLLSFVAFVFAFPG